MENYLDSLKSVYLRIVAVMERQKPYTNPNLTVDELSRMTGVNRNAVSKAINTIGGRNFNGWIASYRVKYLNELFNMSGDLSLPLEELAPKAGFASRSSFYRQFKMITGLTPKQYKLRLAKSGS